MSGILYVVATPIGHLDDITLRAVKTLQSVDLIACEDTRHSLKLLSHLGLQKPLVRYDEHCHDRVCHRLLKELSMGRSVALITDAGTPGISDPGRRLVEAARNEKLTVVPIPGASSVVAALSAAGLPGEGFVFLGFLPRKKGKALRLLQEALRLGKTVAVLESPFRVVDTLSWIEAQSWSLNIVLARELTKIHEEFLAGDAKSLREHLQSREKIGECVLLLQERN
jgi:16S rRNA (cytidine1402-2'-O)-methyltransferase